MADVLDIDNAEDFEVDDDGDRMLLNSQLAFGFWLMGVVFCWLCIP